MNKTDYCDADYDPSKPIDAVCHGDACAVDASTWNVEVTLHQGESTVGHFTVVLTEGGELVGIEPADPLPGILQVRMVEAARDVFRPKAMRRSHW